MYPYLMIIAAGATLVAVVAAIAPGRRSKRTKQRCASHGALHSLADAQDFTELARSAQARADRVAMSHESERMAAAVEQASASACAAGEEIDPDRAVEAYADAALAAYIASALAFRDATLGQWVIRASSRAYVAALCAGRHPCDRCYLKAHRAEEAAVDWIERIRPLTGAESEAGQSATTTTGIAEAETTRAQEPYDQGALSQRDSSEGKSKEPETTAPAAWTNLDS